MRTVWLAIVGVALTGCAIGAPPGFAPGTQWSTPLVGSLEDGILVAPVYIDDHGPFLFAIDPDAYRSVVDEDLANEIHPRGGVGPHVIDESDTQRPALYAEISQLRIGTLRVDQKTLLIRTNHAFDTAGRRIRGLIGRDIIADSLTFGFDRDAGMMYLTTQQGWRAPANAVTIPYELLTNHVYTETPPPGRKLVAATIDGHSYKMHVDLGGPASQLRESLWPDARLAPVPVKTRLIDEVGTVRVASRGAVAGAIAVGPIARGAMFLAGYDDRRWEADDIDGSLGLDFFRPFSVFVNWDRQQIYLTARAPAAQSVTQRIARWDSPALSSCPDVGCARVTLVAEDSGAAPRLDAPPAPTPPPAEGGPGAQPPIGAAMTPPVAAAHDTGAVLDIERDPNAGALDLDLTLGMTAPVGGAALPLVAVNLPRGVERLTVHLGAEFAGASAQVLDVSPIPRPCASGGGCVQLLRAPR